MSTVEMDPIRRLTKDLKKGSATLGPAEARFLVDSYYSIQEDRVRAGNQVKALSGSGEPHEVLAWLGEATSTLEGDIKKALDAYSLAHRAGRWARAQHGIGPVIAAGLLAHIDPKVCMTAGQVWRFAGLDPTVKWLGREGAQELVREVMGASKEVTSDHLIEIEQKTNRKVSNLMKLATQGGKEALTRANLTSALAKRPWNARLKVLLWKMGESFKKHSNSPEAFYGLLYRQRKALEVQRNGEGLFREQAEETLREKRISEPLTKARYEAGQLPDGRLDRRAARWATKIFLSHYQQVAFEVEHGRPAPKPWIIEHGGHQDLMVPPGWPCD